MSFKTAEPTVPSWVEIVVPEVADQAAVDAVLAKLAKEAADPSVNLMPTLIEASKAYATLGEMMNTMANVFGRHVEVPTI
jgi:methylmalonyl-CoA mutase N-terminal domain/subunit